MYGRTADSHQFMARTGTHSTKGSRRGFVDVETGVDPSDLLTPAQRRDNLVRVRDALQARIDHAKAARKGKGLVKSLGRQMNELNNKIGALNKELRGPLTGKDFDYHFVSCARSMLTPSEYERISEKARRRMLEHVSPTPQEVPDGGR